MYHYFVSYSFSNSACTGLGFGYTEVSMDKPLITIEAIHALNQKLSESFTDVSNIVILNFQLLRVESEAK